MADPFLAQGARPVTGNQEVEKGSQPVSEALPLAEYSIQQHLPKAPLEQKRCQKYGLQYPEQAKWIDCPCASVQISRPFGQEKILI